MEELSTYEVYQIASKNCLRCERNFAKLDQNHWKFCRKSKGICGRIQDNQDLINIFDKSVKSKKSEQSFVLCNENAEILAVLMKNISFLRKSIWKIDFVTISD